MNDPELVVSVEVASDLLAHVQGSVEHADRKVRILLAADAVLIALLTSSTQGLLNQALADDATLLIRAIVSVAILLVASVGISILFAFLVIKPRLEFGQFQSHFFFEHIAKKPAIQYVDDFLELSVDQAVKDLLRQVHANSLIARAKFRWVSWSTYFLIAALVLWIVLLLLRMLLTT